MLATHNATAQPAGARASLGKRSSAGALTSARTAPRATRVVTVRSEGQTSQNTGNTESTQNTQSAGTEAGKMPSSPSGSRLQTPEKEDLVKGQGTAIVTGAISIIFGIAYLVLVSLLDVRGGELQPPPPEAFLN
jgi:hypothetical protein